MQKYFIFIGKGYNQNYWYNIHIGITSDEEATPVKKLKCFEEEPESWWPYGWTYLPSDISAWGNGDSNSQKKIINGDVADYLKKFIDNE